MKEQLDAERGSQGRFSRICKSLNERWEVLFFLLLFALLCFQVYAFILDSRSIASRQGGVVGLYTSFEFIIADHLAYIITPAVVLPLVYLLGCRVAPKWARRYLDILGSYIALRMSIQLLGLNLLVFDSVTPGITLLTQLLFFLPYMLLVWGWVYWRLDAASRLSRSRLFRLDCEREVPRPIDYLVASFSTVFSASISAIKGRSARAKMLIIVHGFFVYDVMGLTLSRVVALVQVR